MILAILVSGLIGAVFGYWLRASIEEAERYALWVDISREWMVMDEEERGRARYRAMRPEEFDPVQLDDPSDDWKK